MIRNSKLINLLSIVFLSQLSGCYGSNSTNIANTTLENVSNNEATLLKSSQSKILLLGGNVSTFDASEDAFEHASPKLSEEEKIKFKEGEELFDLEWEVASTSESKKDGLGPFFNSNSCVSCHLADGRGRPPKDGEEMRTMLLRLSIPGKGEHNEPLASHNYGGQLQGFSIPEIKQEAKVSISYQDIKGSFSDGEIYILKKPLYRIDTPGYGLFEKDTMISPRVANQMSGLGLLEDISEKDILALEDIDDRDKDGISGKANYVWDQENKKFSLGRFGWKSNQPTIRQQVAGAFLGDMGITTPIFSSEEITTPQENYLKTTKYVNGGTPELDEKGLDSVILYSKNLSVPARRNINDPEIINGERIFSSISCNKCHITNMNSKEEVIHPYTDLLLHDMGKDLADNRPDFMASGSEWRTAPLWTIGLFKTVNKHTNYMHDGRANNLTEAILWHGGEANDSKEKFKQLPKEQRNELIKFLNSL